MPTRTPICVDCGGSIEPKSDRYHITNIEEAKYGEPALYAHDECPVVDARARVHVQPEEMAVASYRDAGGQPSVRERS